MHMHSMWSGDATTTPDELARAVEETGLDVLCITDHGTINGARELADRLACRVVVGQEVRRRAGELIGLFLSERLPFGIPAEEAAAAIRAQGREHVLVAESTIHGLVGMASLGPARDDEHQVGVKRASGESCRPLAPASI